MKPTVAQRVLLSVSLTLSLLFAVLIYMNEYGLTLVATEFFQLARIVVIVMALIMGFGGKKKITFALIYFGTFLLAIVANFFIGFNFLASIYRGLFNVRSWMYLDIRELMPYIIITLVVNAPFLVAYILGLTQKAASEMRLPAPASAPQIHMSQAPVQGEIRSLRGDLESLAGLLREGLITQDDYDRKKEEILRRL
ncbi:MAG: SHOCT domain-containing protein [Actinomycetes bacterium]